MKWIIFVLLAISTISCKTIREIEYRDREVIVERKDTTTIYNRDSIFEKEYIKGDTVFKTKYVERIKYKDRIVIQVDSISKEVFVDKEVEKKVIPAWCYWALIGSLVQLILFILYLKFRKR